MSRRIDIELTSARDDGSWTWRAAGARQPKGTLPADILPEAAAVGDVLRVEVEAYMDGMDVVAVVPRRAPRREPERLELRPTRQDNAPLVTGDVATKRSAGRAKGRGRERDGRDGPRREGRRDARSRREGGRERRERPESSREGRDGTERPQRDRREGRSGRRTRPAPPPMDTKPKPKRLRPGKTHRTQLLDSLPAEQRPIAEQLLAGGIPAVRQAIDKQNASLRAEGKPEVKPDALLRVAEDLRPQVLAALWRDRADVAVAAVDELDLRDLRSVVNAADDAGRDKDARALAAQLREALANRVEKEHAAWLAELTEMLRDGRVVRALRLSSRPPKAGAPIPPELTVQLTEAASAALTDETGQERWATVLDALAFSPVRRRVVPQSLPTKLSSELAETIARLGSRLPEIAHIFDIEPVEAPARNRPPRRRGKPGGTGSQNGQPSKARDAGSSADRPKARRGAKATPDAAPSETATPSDAVASGSVDAGDEAAAVGDTPADTEAAGTETATPSDAVASGSVDAGDEAAVGDTPADTEAADTGEAVTADSDDADAGGADVDVAASETAPDRNGATDSGQDADAMSEPVDEGLVESPANASEAPLVGETELVDEGDEVQGDEGDAADADEAENSDAEVNGVEAEPASRRG